MPTEPKGLSDRLQRTAVSPAQWHISWCRHFSAGVKIVEERVSWRWGFLTSFELLHPLLVGSSTLAINTPPHTNQCKNLKVAEKLSVIELRLRCSWLWVPSACQGKTDVRKLSELNHHDEIKAKKHLVHAIKKIKDAWILILQEDKTREEKRRERNLSSHCDLSNHFLTPLPALIE